MTTQEDCEKAYAEGVEDAKSDGIISSLGHMVADMVVPDSVLDKEAQSREAGYHDYMTGKVK